MATAYDTITNRILDQLEKGNIPWQRPWASRGEAGLPRNLRTLKPYRGINVWVLMSAGYSSPYFLTFKQAQELGGSVRKGEHGLPVVYWQFGEHSKANGDGELENHEYAFCRYYTVFNVCQCENLAVTPVPPPDEHPEIPPIQACDAVVSDWQGKPEITHGTDRACYIPRYDRVNMPDRNTFDSSEFYYSVLFHELGHSTGHEKRLARNTLLEIESWGDTQYSREELCAEMTAAYLCGNRHRKCSYSAELSGVYPELAFRVAGRIQSWY